MNRPCQVEAGNRFLLAVSRAAKRLNDQLEVIPLSRGTVLTHAGACADNLYFRIGPGVAAQDHGGWSNG
jgi:hypothetical protein